MIIHRKLTLYRAPDVVFIGTMSHRIIPFTCSNLITINKNLFTILKEEPLYTPSKLVQYDFDDGSLTESDPIQARSQDWHVLDSRPTTNVLYRCSWLNAPVHNYENLDDYPELKIFFEKENNSPDLVIYGENYESYQLHVWHNQAYIVSLNDEITAYLIDETYYLQSGDMNTYVWFFNDNFVVYNDGDVYSVILVLANKDDV